MFTVPFLRTRNCGYANWNQSMPSKNLAEIRQVCDYYPKYRRVKHFKTGLKCVRNVALADVAQLFECRPANQKVTCSIPSQGTCLGCGPGSRKGVCERQPHIDVSLPLFLPPFPSLKINNFF